MSIQEIEQQHFYYLAQTWTRKSIKDSTVCNKCTQIDCVKAYTTLMQYGLICLTPYLHFAINADAVLSVMCFVRKIRGKIGMILKNTFSTGPILSRIHKGTNA